MIAAKVASVTILMAAMAAPAWAVTVRPTATLERADVRLSDLFDDLSSDRVLGPAPRPGERFTVDTPQLAAIARQFGVAWRPQGGERTVVERTGRPLPREAALVALRAALSGGGAPEGAEVELSAYAAPVLPTGGDPAVSVSSLDYDRTTGRFAAMLTVTSADRSVAGVRLVGQVWETIALPVLLRRLPAGAVPSDVDVETARVRSALVRDEVATRASDLVGRSLRRPLLAGVPVSLADLTAPIMVRRGAMVSMVLDSPGITVTARGTALEPGGRGDRIRVQNPNSRAVMEAEITGEDRVRVDPGNAPTVPADGVSPIARKLAVR